MKRKKGFTLAELLVVISIITLLMSVLVPALNKARDLAKRIVCGSNIHTLGVANSTYEAIYGVFAPVAYDTALPPQYPPGDVNLLEGIWCNSAFRKITAIDSYRDEPGVDPLITPDEFRCPSDTVEQASRDGVLLSYGYNLTDWVEEAWAGGIWADDYYAGHGPGAVRTPADKLAFIDAPDWWVQWEGADFAAQLPGHPRGGWDVYGQRTIDFYQNLGYYGPVFYRHNEGANVGFYDGHVEYMKKQDVFSEDDYNAGRPGMWAVKY